MFEYIFKVKGMYCQMCEVHINEAVRTACNADKVISDRRRNETKVIADDLDTSAVMGAIRSLGYDTDGFSVHPYRKKSVFDLFGRGKNDKRK